MKRGQYWAKPKSVKGGWWYANPKSIEVHANATIGHVKVRIPRKQIVEYLRRTKP